MRKPQRRMEHNIEGWTGKVGRTWLTLLFSPSVWRLCHRPTQLRSKHKRRRRFPAGRVQCRRKFPNNLRKERAILTSIVQSVRSQIAEAQKIAGGSGSEQDIAEAKIELEVGFFSRRLDFTVLANLVL